MSLSKEQERVQNLHLLIRSTFDNLGYTLISNLESDNISTKSRFVKYICWCGEEKHKYVKDALEAKCRGCTNKKLKEIPTDISVCPSDNKEEKWIPIKGGFISSLGRGCNVFGKILTPDEDFCYYFAGKSQYASIILANAFKIDGYEKLDGPKSQYIVRIKDRTKLPTLNDIWIGTRAEVGQLNGTKSRHSEDFEESKTLSIVHYLKTYDHHKISDLPNHIIFEDGNIFNECPGNGGNRFLTFSTTSTNPPYKKLITNDKVFPTHRLVCMAFYPIEGKNSYDDYSELKVNHKDGNTLNNHKNNLEWATDSENMNHAYQTSLNKKVQGVIQFEKLGDKKFGKQIAEFLSIAEASRKTKVPEHEIREVCKGKATGIRGFLWKFKDEEKAALYSQKFSSK